MASDSQLSHDGRPNPCAGSLAVVSNNSGAGAIKIAGKFGGIWSPAGLERGRAPTPPSPPAPRRAGVRVGGRWSCRGDPASARCQRSRCLADLHDYVVMPLALATWTPGRRDEREAS